MTLLIYVSSDVARIAGFTPSSINFSYRDLTIQIRVSHSITYSPLDRNKSTLIFPQQLTYSFHRNKVAHFYLNASRTRSFTFPTLILYFKFRILGHCPRDFGLDCSRYKHKTHALHFKSFTLLKHNPTLTTRLTHTHPITRLWISHSQLH